MLVKTHLIVTDQYDDYRIKWVRRLIDTHPKLNDKGLPTFVIIANQGRLEMNTVNMGDVAAQAKKFTFPRGRGAITTDKGFIYIKEEKEEVLLGVVIHDHIRKYAPMYDEV